MSHSEEKGIERSNDGDMKALYNAESKSQSFLPPKPGSDEKKHWSTTEDGALVARATAHVYRAIVASQTQGGMQDFLLEKCDLFKDLSGEQSLECTVAFQKYEKHIDASLDEFASSEGKTCVEVLNAAERICTSHKMAAKNLQMLLAATGYDKFSKMMNRKYEEKEAKKNEEAAGIEVRTRKPVRSREIEVQEARQRGEPDAESESKNSCPEWVDMNGKVEEEGQRVEEK